MGEWWGGAEEAGGEEQEIAFLEKKIWRKIAEEEHCTLGDWLLSEAKRNGVLRGKKKTRLEEVQGRAGHRHAEVLEEDGPAGASARVPDRRTQTTVAGGGDRR